jgi:uncharacterized protein (DUF58 family)
MKQLPTRRLILLALAAVPLAVRAPWLVVCWDLVLLALFLLEGRRLASLAPACERVHDERLVVGVANTIRLRLHNPSAYALRVTVRDDTPAGWTVTPDDLSVELPPFARRELSYAAEPPRRGDAQFGDLHLRIDGGPRLCTAAVTVPAERDVRVFPNVLGPRRYDMAARLGELALLGFRTIRKDGQGGEFEKLREYVPGDDYGDIEWRATARRGRPIVRVHQRERSQQVLLCVDAGRMMATRLGSITKLDHAINAALLTAFVALRQGDRVGLVVFAGEVRAFVPPRVGGAQYRRLLDALATVEPELTFVDFRRMTDFVRARVPRRSLVLLFSDLLDEAHAAPLATCAPILAERHLPVCCTLSDDVVRALSEASPATAADVYQRAAAADLLEEQQAIRAKLSRGGVELVEASAGELAVATVNRYLELKRRGRL